MNTEKRAMSRARRRPMAATRNLRFRRRRLLAAIALTAGTLGAGLFLGVWRTTHLTSGSAAGSNVLLITIDTLRVDRVGAYGNRSGLTPTLDQLAERAVRFESAYTPAPLTLPAHASILTGLEPPSHGIRNNTAFKLGRTPTLATMLKSAGYRTGAFVGALVLSARFGLNRDFDVYDDRIGGDGDPAGVRLAERRADEVIRPATEWILRAASRVPANPTTTNAPGQSRPWFAWIHLYDPHAPYRAPAEYGLGRAPYDAEVAYTDAMIGRGLETLRTAGQLDRTIVVVVADHGESLGEHGEATHGLFAYDATLHVPMMVTAPGVGGRVVRTPVASVDLVPTVLDLLGIEAPPGLDGRSLLNADRDGARSRALYFEALDANLTRGWAPLMGVMVDGWKFIDLPIPEVYDLPHDPQEARNVVERDPGRLRTLQARLNKIGVERSAVSRAVRAVVDAETSRRLASLGYIGSVERTDKRAFSAEDDPKNLVGLNEAFYAAVNEQLEGHRESALATLRQILTKRPDFLAARMTVAAILGAERPAEEIALLQSAPGAATSATAQAQLGLAFEAAGNLTEAAKCLERAVRLREGDVEMLTSLGIVYARLRRFDEGRRLFRQVLESEPRALEVWNNLGLLELSAGNRPAAVEAFRQAIAADPNHAAAWRGLGAALVAIDASAATEAWRRAVALAPRDYDTLFNLGTVLSEGPQPQAALVYLKQFVAEAPRDRYGRDIARAAALISRIEQR